MNTSGSHPGEEPSSAGLKTHRSASPPTVPDYQLLRRIGSGAYGDVWLARSTATNVLRAVKIVYRSTFIDERPFQREFEGILKFEAVSRSHPSQLALFHVGRDETAGYFYYVMELADPASPEGSSPCSVARDPSEARNQELPPKIADPLSADYFPRTLRSDLRAGRLPAARVLELGLALTEALGHLHARGLVHRDIKPSNIIFVGGRPKLADIGLVTDAATGDDRCSIVGTAGYLPFEGAGTSTADLFALSRVLYEALTGLDRRRFPELPADLRQWPDAPLAFELNSILVRAGAADARQRYSSAESLREDLQLLHMGKSVKRRRAWRRQWAVAGKLMVAFFVLAFVVFPWLRPRRPQPNGPTALPPVGGDEMRGTTNRSAWDAFQIANQISRMQTEQAFTDSIAEYERAVTLDPGFAVGWYSLAGRRANSVEFSHVPFHEGLPRALAEAEKALQLDPSLGATYSLIALCRLSLDYDFVAAEPLFRRAIQLTPNSPGPRSDYANTLAFYGRFKESEILMKELIRDFPSQSFYRAKLGEIYGFAGRYEEALAQGQGALRLNPNDPLHVGTLGQTLWMLGRRQEAAEHWLRFDRLSGCSEAYLAAREEALKESGPEGYIRARVADVESAAARGERISPYEQAWWLGYLGEKQRALDYLERAVEEHRFFVLSAKVHSGFKDFKNERRYHDVLKRLKLE